ncbi:MAG TPA: class I SAM-dependent methyltransferase [Blastocatellia bacterium]|nr:class I SAM-dependent methyltransferase [Blastocatellia bacterium]
MSCPSEMISNHVDRIPGEKMGFYSHFITPRLIEWGLGSEQAMRLRTDVVSAARGKVLEIGFGTGLNLRAYPPSVERVVAIDPEKMLPDRVQKRLAESRVPVELIHLDASNRLPYDDASFDTIVSTWTLCSIADVDSALTEVRRLLRSDARFLFLEHGRSDNPKIAKRQDWWNPIQRIIGSGCNTNRAIDQLVSRAGLKIEKLDRFLMPATPRILAEMYKGIAVRE